MTAKLLITGAILIIALIFILPYAGTRAAEALIREDPIVQSDVIIALGGDKRCHREKHAAELYKRGLASHIIVSGVQYGYGVHTGEAAKRYVVSQGVPESAVSIIRDTWNTRTEAARLKELMEKHGWKRGIVVTAAFHSRRALHTVEDTAPEYHFISSPVPAWEGEWRPERWWSRRGDMWVTVREFLSWGNTLVGGLQ
ncbi:MAG: YdcF family protein [Acidobacteriota bacterium]|nr:MAG: YdcF family protein [Acidobacteriota bacterium]